MFSKACEYAIRAMIFIAVKSQQGVRVGITDIADETGSPVSFTAKILQRLVKSNLLESLKGPSGGFVISDERSERIRLSEIVTAIDGDHIYKGCALGFDECNEDQPCPIHYKYKDIRADFKNMLEETTLRDLSNNITQGLSFLKRI
jgi:Rrf2 family iron-sulfur cluster assembly transcriptional regulator